MIPLFSPVIPVTARIAQHVAPKVLKGIKEGVKDGLEELRDDFLEGLNQNPFGFQNKSAQFGFQISVTPPQIRFGVRGYAGAQSKDGASRPRGKPSFGAMPSLPSMPVDSSQLLLSKLLNAATGLAQSMDDSAKTTNEGKDGNVDETTEMLNDPSLTVEDKVTLLIMMIMKKMDKEIEEQANYVNSLQNKQGNKSGGGDTSIDVESQKMARLVTKRGQMFDLLRQIIDKYNETAKGVIQAMGR